MKTKIFKSCGIITLLYSTLVFLGGFIGFVTEGSTPSLLMGGLFGLVLLYTSILILLYRQWAIFFACTLMILLDAFFTFRYLKTHVIFPSTMMIAISSLAIILLLVKLSKLLKNSNKTLQE